MHVGQEAVQETLRSIQRFLDDNGEKLDAVNKSLARQRLDEMVAQISAHAVAQVAGRRSSEGETAKQRALRLALRDDHMRPITVIAGQKLREQPEFKLLRMPPWSIRGPGLTTAAYDMANAAEKYTDLFIHDGLPIDFVAALRAAAVQLDESIDVRGQIRGKRAGATEGLKADTKRAKGLIRILDSQVRPKLGTDDELLRQWQLARHIRRERIPAKATSAAGTPTTAVTTPAPTAAPTTTAA